MLWKYGLRYANIVKKIPCLKRIADRGLRSELISGVPEHVKKFSWVKTAAGILNSCEKALQAS